MTEGAHIASPDFLAGFRGPTSKGGDNMEVMKGGERE